MEKIKLEFLPHKDFLNKLKEKYDFDYYNLSMKSIYPPVEFRTDFIETKLPYSLKDINFAEITDEMKIHNLLTTTTFSVDSFTGDIEIVKNIKNNISRVSLNILEIESLFELSEQLRKIYKFSEYNYKKSIAIINGETNDPPSWRFWKLKDFYHGIKTNLKTMKYNKFLNTVYWDLVRKTMLRRYGRKCQLCNISTEKLNVHHRTYKFRGEELFNLKQSLIVLCYNCHQKFHKMETIS